MLALCIEHLGIMPREFLQRYTAPEIAEIQAYFLMKQWEREAEDAQRELDRQRDEVQALGAGGRTRRRGR